MDETKSETKDQPTQTPPAQATDAAPEGPAVTRRPMTQLQSFFQNVLSGDSVSELKRALPKHISWDRFERAAYNAVMQNPDIMRLNARLVFREISRIAGAGLLLDPLMGEAWVIKGYNSRTRQDEPQARVGYRGLIKLARQSGEVALVYAHEVCKQDTFTIQLGTEKSLIHSPNMLQPRGEVIGYYAVVKFKDGQTDFEVMDREAIDRIRDATEAYKALKNGRIKTTPWQSHYDEMAKKTVLRRLLKRMPQSPDTAEAIARAIAIEDRAEGYADEAPQQAPERKDGRRPRNAADALDRFAGNGKANVTDVEPEGPLPDNDQGSGDAQQVDGEGQGVDQPSPAASEEAARARTPVMPPVTLKAWTEQKQWYPGWQWIESILQDEAYSLDTKLATVKDHLDLVRTAANDTELGPAVLYTLSAAKLDMAVKGHVRRTA